MNNVYVHPNILQHPGRIRQLEFRTRMRVTLGPDNKTARLEHRPTGVVPLGRGPDDDGPQAA